MNKQEIEARLDKVISRIQFIQFGDWISLAEEDELKKLDVEYKDLKNKLCRIEAGAVKAAFVEKLRNFYMNECDNELNIIDMKYEYDAHEKIVVFCPTGRKSFCIDYADKEEMLRYFAKFIGEFDNIDWEIDE